MGSIPEWFDVDGIDTEFLQDFQGILLLRSDDGSSFAPLGIQFRKRGESLSVIPVIRVTTVPELRRSPDIGSGLACVDESEGCGRLDRREIAWSDTGLKPVSVFSA